MPHDSIPMTLFKKILHDFLLAESSMQVYEIGDVRWEQNRALSCRGKVRMSI